MSVGGILAAGEREEVIVPFLRWVKNLIGDADPALFTNDFKDAWEAAVKMVFPHATITICTFRTRLETKGLLF